MEVLHVNTDRSAIRSVVLHNLGSGADQAFGCGSSPTQHGNRGTNIDSECGAAGRNYDCAHHNSRTTTDNDRAANTNHDQGWG